MADEATAATHKSLSISFPVWVCVRKDNPDSLMGGTITGGVPFVFMALRVFWWVTFPFGRQIIPFNPEETRLPLGEITCHAFAMAKFKSLPDLYRFPGFVPLPQVRGLFADPLAVVITLQRRRKKRSAVSAAKSIAAITTSAHDRFAIFPVATNASILPFSCAGSLAHGVLA
jgi:hypothetical protein